MDWRTSGRISFDKWMAVLDDLDSPIHAEGRAAYDAAGDLSALALAMLIRESHAGTRFNLNRRENHNALNLRPPSGGGYMAYETWTEGIQAWRDRITSPTYKNGIYNRTETVAELLNVYAPPSDNNDTPAYIRAVEDMIRDWNPTQGEPTVPSIPTKHSVPKPVIYNLATDYARYGLSSGQAQEIINSRFPNRNGAKPRFIVYHIQAGSTRGSLGWWARNDIDASSTIMANKDGSLLYIVPEQHGPWTNGDVNRPTPEASEILAKGGNPNIHSLTIEKEGQPGDPLSTDELNALIWITEEWIMRYPEILDSEWCLLRHGFINSVDKARCGLYMDPVVEAVNAWLDGGTVPVPPEEPEQPPALYPEGMTEQLAKRLYGSVEVSWSSKPFTFDPDRSECQYWLARGKLSMTGDDYTTGQWPPLEDVIRRGSTKGTHVYQWANGDAYEKVLRKDA